MAKNQRNEPSGAIITDWASTLISLVAVVISLIAIFSVGIHKADSIAVSMAVLQTFLAFGAFATFFIFRNVVERKAHDVAEKEMEVYLSVNGNGAALVREIMESWRPPQGAQTRTEDETDNIMEALSDEN